jgi:hypothetical protein
MEPTQRQLALIDHLRQQLGMSQDELEAVTRNNHWNEVIIWPLTRKSASALITELQLRKQDRIERSKIS